MIARRQFIAGLSSVTVLGFNPLEGVWINEASASSLERIPELDGELVMDAASLSAVARDAGNIVHKVPVAVLRPGSVHDISKMVQFCRKYHIKVAARGQGHTTFGQSQVSGGLIIETRTLNQMTLHQRTADVGAGVKWNELLAAATAQGLTPPVFTGYTELSIGGTLSVGGVPASYRRGIQVEHVKELEVVTGEGEIVRCSERRRRALFEAVLAGLGQCGIITRAVVALEPAKQRARQFVLEYTENSVFFRDLRTLMERGEFNDLFNFWVPDGAGGWIYQLNAITFYNAGAPPDDAHLLRGLNFNPATQAVADSSYVEYILRVDVAIEFFRQIGLWDDVLHPWFDVILPNDGVEAYIGDVLPRLTPEDVGPTGFLLLFPLERSKLTRPLFRVPEGPQEYVWLFDILTAAPVPGPDAEFEARMLNRNRQLFERARDMGGKRYPIGALEFGRSDWIQHYGAHWRDFARAKRRFDPSRILTPGPGIF